MSEDIDDCKEADDVDAFTILDEIDDMDLHLDEDVDFLKMKTIDSVGEDSPPDTVEKNNDKIVSNEENIISKEVQEDKIDKTDEQDDDEHVEEEHEEKAEDANLKDKQTEDKQEQEASCGDEVKLERTEEDAEHANEDSELLENEISLLDKTEVSDVDNLDESKGDEQEADAEVETHPYLYLIETFEPPKEQLNFTTVGVLKNLEEKPLININSKVALLKMLQSLRTAKEIAVDLQIADKEFKEPVCLIDISTKDTDYIIDAVKMKHDLLMLTEIFINPKIVKIMFSSNSVLSCLQQKLHLFVVNIFDVEKAKSILLEKPQKNWSLTTILKNDFSYSRVKLNNADFRRRPIPDDYKAFCRAATHYLIYIYHDYKNRLIARDPDVYKKFLDECRDACKKLHSNTKVMTMKSLQDELVTRHKCELQVLKKVFNWRFTLAKKRNVKPEMVLSRSSMMTLVRDLPTQDNILHNIMTSVYAKSEINKIKEFIVESKITLRVRETKLQNKRTKREFPKQQRKRYFDDPSEQPQKIRRLDYNQKPNMQNHFSNKKSNEKFGHNRQTPNKNSQKRNNTHQQNKNFNAPPSLMDNFQPDQLLITNFSTTNNSFNKHGNNSRNRKHSRFDPSEDRHTPNQRSSNFSMNMSKPMILNPTNIPSSATFQSNANNSNFSPFDNFNNQKDNRFNQEESVLQMSLANLEQASANIRRQVTNNEEDMLYRSLVDLKQARDSIRRQTDGFSGNYDLKKHQDLNMIDQKINTLERRVKQVQARNNSGRSNKEDGQFRRRYY